MSPAELNALLDRMNENYINRPDTDIRRCQVCGVNWQRDFTKRWPGHRDRVVCNTCSRNEGRQVEYCWGCGQQWRGNGYGCGNSDCTWERDQLRVLANCITKTIGSVDGCPIIRACPRCGTLIHHEEGCNHMTCKCGCEFCFFCLKRKKCLRRWECTAWSVSCPVVARQTSLPQPNLPVQVRRRNLVGALFRNYLGWFRGLFRQNT